MTLASAVNLNSTTPAPASGKQNIVFANDGGSPTVNQSATDPNMIGDTGSGGTAGNVPAPASGDAAAGKFLKANGTWAVPSGGSGAAASLPPYLQIGTSLFIASDFMYEATPPTTHFATPSWLNSVAPTSTTNGANGNQILQTTSSITAWASASAAASAEGVFALTSTAAINSNVYPQVGVWLYDSTNGKIYSLTIALNSDSTTGEQMLLAADSWTYTGSGNPSSPSSISEPVHGAWGFGAPIHLKIIVAGGTLSFQYSIDGGQSFITIATQSVGTITEAGYTISGPAGSITTANVLSIVVA